MDIYDIIADYLSQGKSGVLSTIVKRTGATPQGPGAKMFIGDDGRIFGTVGGGCVEAEIWSEAQKTLKTKEARLLQYALDGGSVEDEGMICGGTVHVFLEPVCNEHRAVYRNIGDFRKTGRRAVTVTRFGADGFFKSLLTVDGISIGDPMDDTQILQQDIFDEKRPRVSPGKIIEPLAIGSTVYIYGAGHISRFISKLAKMMDFTVVVLDDREQFANREAFPEADEIIVDDFENAVQHINSEDETYVVVVTRGHKHDALILEKVLTKKQRYIGMIGSKRKTKIIFDYLAEKGFDSNVLKTVHAPIGIDINSETPQEIALSIVAELVKKRKEEKL